MRGPTDRASERTHAMMMTTKKHGPPTASTWRLDPFAPHDLHVHVVDVAVHCRAAAVRERRVLAAVKVAAGVAREAFLFVKAIENSKLPTFRVDYDRGTRHQNPRRRDKICQIK